MYMHVGLVDLLTKNGTPGTNSLLVLFFFLFFLFFLVLPGGPVEGPAGPPTPERGKGTAMRRIDWRAARHEKNPTA